ncbi:hypothetical protein FA15DRAFT_249574 [Coprinopsis marcescibilis]|uniref:AA9 family lytic polysaccharide monooxygenase n=1 Tax=Coprinopsis marcescibilis TaxID=230819 RepID=A0A5C3KFP4_COPMA|nr:hypothetical protein FA15DRAFT_249574 [Coprinopsis marcescibilis]
MKPGTTRVRLSSFNRTNHIHILTMKVFGYVALLAAVAQSASAHYIWTTLVANGSPSNSAVRQPMNNTPVENVSSAAMACGNGAARSASDIVSVSAGSRVGFRLDNTLYHPGPAALYLGQVPGGQSASSWDGSGNNWFKIEEWGAQFNPFKFIPDGQRELFANIPSSTPDGEYLLRIEHIGLHVAGSPQYYISCAQIRVSGGGGGSPPKVSIPGYVQRSDPGLTVNIHWPIPTQYTVPGPRPWKG